MRALEHSTEAFVLSHVVRDYIDINHYSETERGITHPATQLQMPPVTVPVSLVNHAETVYGGFFMEGRHTHRTRHVRESSDKFHRTWRT